MIYYRVPLYKVPFVPRSFFRRPFASTFPGKTLLVRPNKLKASESIHGKLYTSRAVGYADYSIRSWHQNGIQRWLSGQKPCYSSTDFSGPVKNKAKSPSIVGLKSD